MVALNRNHWEGGCRGGTGSRPEREHWGSCAPGVCAAPTVGRRAASNDIINDFAGNRLLAPIGIQWLNSSLKRTSPAGYAVAEPPSELTHAGKAFNAVEAHIAGRRKLTQPEVDQTLYTLARTIRALPPNDVLFAPDLQGFFSNYEGTRWPSAKQPVDESDVVARMVATLFVSEHHRTPPQSVRAHPAATDFPGSVPTDAPRLTRSLIIDTTVPRWHSTGLYAAPGDLVTVTVPTRVANGGFRAHWPHSDNWKRPKEAAQIATVHHLLQPRANASGCLHEFQRRPVRTIPSGRRRRAPVFGCGQTRLWLRRRITAPGGSGE